MNVSLTPELEGFARSLVETGRYNSASEVMRESLRLLQEREANVAHLRALIREGVESGEPTAYDREEVRTMLLQHAATLRAEKGIVP